MKYLLLLVVLLVAFGVWRSRRGSDTAATKPSQAPALPLNMLACAHCGVHIPQPDALMVGRDAYCCAEHRSLGPS